ncbi:NAD kinase [Paraburkholderia tropica]|uniref:sugar kinase n=1 Tax=Paraburkholderia tropica TaxID=92647 RepID=UPI001608DFEF|nr:sugar kinase [Paraburkholderia tropica]MBB3002825.1 NAD kinase [Paraburkholderia tropica]MBB6320422.1 NAD kinase [Paraburkholderia tropica]
MSAESRKVVLVTRRTRYEELIARHHTLAQARFYIEHLGADFSDYLAEHAAYARALELTVRTLEDWGRYQIVDRSYLPNFIFVPDDIVVALGQDGIVANSMKYLDGQPLIGLNPEPGRWDGVLLPFEAPDLRAVLADVAHSRPRRATKSVTMAEARLSDGQVLRAVNDLFIGPRTHASALYEIELGERCESQSSSGVIVSTGLGSTAWIKSVVTGSIGVSEAVRGSGGNFRYEHQDWDSPELTFAVREPFPSRASKTELVFGHVSAAQPLRVRSRMPENGVIFSDGMESDYLRFTAGMEATVTVAETRGCLVI